MQNFVDARICGSADVQTYKMRMMTQKLMTLVDRLGSGPHLMGRSGVRVSATLRHQHRHTHFTC